jgi:hypothetical protein
LKPVHFLNSSFFNLTKPEGSETADGPKSG